MFLHSATKCVPPCAPGPYMYVSWKSTGGIMSELIRCSRDSFSLFASHVPEITQVVSFFDVADYGWVNTSEAKGNAPESLCLCSSPLQRIVGQPEAPARRSNLPNEIAFLFPSCASCSASLASSSSGAMLTKSVRKSRVRSNSGRSLRVCSLKGSTTKIFVKYILQRFLWELLLRR